MIKKRQNQLIQIYKQSQALSNWLWMGILLDAEDAARQDTEWAKEISSQIARALHAYSKLEKSGMAKAPAGRKSNARPAGHKSASIAELRSRPVVAENIETGETREFSSGKAAAAALGVHRSAISRVINGKAQSTKGYRFRLAN